MRGHRRVRVPACVHAGVCVRTCSEGYVMQAVLDPMGRLTPVSAIYEWVTRQ